MSAVGSWAQKLDLIRATPMPQKPSALFFWGVCSRSGAEIVSVMHLQHHPTFERDKSLQHLSGLGRGLAGDYLPLASISVPLCRQQSSDSPETT